MAKEGTVLALAVVAALGIYFMTKKGCKSSGVKVPVTQAFASIMDKLQTAWVYRNEIWYMYDPTDPVGSNLTYVEDCEIIHLYVSAPCTLTYGTKSFSLVTGYNKITW